MIDERIQDKQRKFLSPLRQDTPDGAFPAWACRVYRPAHPRIDLWVCDLLHSVGISQRPACIWLCLRQRLCACQGRESWENKERPGYRTGWILFWIICGIYRM